MANRITNETLRATSIILMKPNPDVSRLWSRLREVIRDCLTFSDIKDAAAAAGLPIQRLAHLQQRRTPNPSNSKSELLDEIGVLIAEESETARREVVTEFVRKCLKNRPDRRDDIIRHAERTGFALDSFDEIVFNPGDQLTQERTLDASASLNLSELVSAAAPFISYAREDALIAQRLYRDLKSAGCAPWLDSEKILGGQDFDAIIKSAIRNSTHVIALLSEHSVNKQGYVQKELRHALGILDEFPPDQIYLIPVRLDSSLPKHERLQALQWIDLFSPRYRDGLRRIFSSLRVDFSQEESRFNPEPEIFSSIYAKLDVLQSNGHALAFAAASETEEKQRAFATSIEELKGLAKDQGRFLSPSIVSFLRLILDSASQELEQDVERRGTQKSSDLSVPLPYREAIHYLQWLREQCDLIWALFTEETKQETRLSRYIR